jgi:signal transduction histidine kinase
MYFNIRKEKERMGALLQAEALTRQEHVEFMAMISHEFRTPLSIITAASGNLQYDAELSEKSRGRVEKIMRANGRLQELMDKHLTSERLLFDAASTELAVCDLRQCAERVVGDFRDLDGARVELEDGSSVYVRGNAELIRLALSNLLSNAKRYSPDDGVISIRLRELEGWVSLQVQDEGPGIGEHEISRVFEKYFRGSSSSGRAGAGLGLYLVQMIMRRHEGRVEVTNLPDGGCSFSLCFRPSKSGLSVL